MLIARIENNTVAEVADYRAMFPGTSFPPNGPSKEFLAENNCLGVTVFKPHDRNTEKLVPCAPYIDGDEVFTVEVVPKTAEELQAAEVAAANALKESIISATQARLDDFARTRGYDGILSACTYATSPTDKFQTEGQYCVISRDATWAKLYQMLAEVQAGTRPIPSGYADIEPELPPLVWPN